MTLKSGFVVFNFHQTYPRWEKFFSVLRSALEEFRKAELLSQVFRIGLRFRNSFENLNVFDIIKPSWRVNLSGYNTRFSTIKTKILVDDFTIILNLGTDFLISNSRISLIDLDVIYESREGISFEELFTHVVRFNASRLAS